MDNVYKGWRITFNCSLPITGRWRAERYGVSMCNNSQESIRRMVDQKCLDARADAERRGAI